MWIAETSPVPGASVLSLRWNSTFEGKELLERGH